MGVLRKISWSLLTFVKDWYYAPTSSAMVSMETQSTCRIVRRSRARSARLRHSNKDVASCAGA
eukprot:9133264-Karenia_brevis.AAC.1